MPFSRLSFLCGVSWFLFNAVFLFSFSGYWGRVGGGGGGYLIFFSFSSSSSSYFGAGWGLEKLGKVEPNRCACVRL